VQGLYKVVKSVDKNKIFGVSPAGGFVGDIPDSDVKNLSTDLLKWCKNPGYIDYVMPQIYWDYNHATAPFSEVFNKWDNFVSSEDVALYPGLAPYKIPQLMSQESIYKQIADINASKKAKGFALFRYENIVSMKFN
ncbi:MAG: family 10 glycosylhydrolase, partial [Oscillospiraceae bacterium]